MTMPAPASRCQRVFSKLLLLALAGSFAVAGLAVLGLMTAKALPAPTFEQDTGSRQVTLFGVLATPSSNTLDPQLKDVAAQLRKLLPGHGFKMLGAPQSKRLAVGETLACEKLNQFSVEVGLLDPLD